MNGSWVLSDIINENIHVHILREYISQNIYIYFHKKETVEDSFF